MRPSNGVRSGYRGGRGKIRSSQKSGWQRLNHQISTGPKADGKKTESWLLLPPTTPTCIWAGQKRFG